MEKDPLEEHNRIVKAFTPFLAQGLKFEGGEPEPRLTEGPTKEPAPTMPPVSGEKWWKDMPNEWGSCRWYADGKNDEKDMGSWCHPERLRKIFEEEFDVGDSGGKSVYQKAIEAAQICKVESGGDPFIVNDRCDPYDPKHYTPRQRSLDYSVGLFQINKIVHCAGAFSDYGSKPVFCKVKDWDKVRNCEEANKDPLHNIEEALRISGNGKGWSAWSAAAVCSIK